MVVKWSWTHPFVWPVLLCVVNNGNWLMMCKKNVMVCLPCLESVYIKVSSFRLTNFGDCNINMALSQISKTGDRSVSRCVNKLWVICFHIASHLNKWEVQYQ